MPRVRHSKTTSHSVNGVTYRTTQSRGWMLGPYHQPWGPANVDSSISAWRFPLFCGIGLGIYGLLQLPWWGAVPGGIVLLFVILLAYGTIANIEKAKKPGL